MRHRSHSWKMVEVRLEPRPLAASCNWAWGQRPVTLGPTLEVILVWGTPMSKGKTIIAQGARTEGPLTQAGASPSLGLVRHVDLERRRHRAEPEGRGRSPQQG